MKRRLDTLVDKGCWISHDRIYAFISADHGITEIGYHGTQPVSRNSRILVNEPGVLTFSVRSEIEGQKLQTSEIDWQASNIEAETQLTNGGCRLTIEARGQRLVIRCAVLSADGQTVCIKLAKDAFFKTVHGERTWSPLLQQGNSLVTQFRDRIMLQSWMNRTGPYAGDFLIPEPIRRKIFVTSKRSGLATRQDLREEFRINDIPLYDARVSIRFGGDGFFVREESASWFFERLLVPDEEAEFTIECSDPDENLAIRTRQSALLSIKGEKETRTTPSLALEGFPNLEEFASTVPSLVDSCTTPDYGIPKACPGRYYWIWAWDSLVTMTEALRWGDSRNAMNSVRFIEDHRDDNGHIPARWTRTLLPLDTPSAGGIEFLQVSLAYETFLETGERPFLTRCFPSFITRFEEVESDLLRHGHITGE
jgi:hypothetical protein